MNLERLPIIGRAIKAREDARIERILEALPKPKLSEKAQKSYDILGGILDIPEPKLSNETTISSKLLAANKEWVYRNNDVIAMEVSKIEFELYQIGLKDGEIIFTEIHTHKLLDLLDKPNPETTKSDAVYIVQSHKKLTGDAFWLKLRQGRTVVGLRSLPPDKITLDLENPTESDQTVIKGFMYKDVINDEKVEAYYVPEDIIHIKKPSPNNLFRGFSAVEAMAETIDVDNLTNLTTKNFFKKGAITNFILSSEQKINEEQIKRIQAEMKQMYGGAQNAYRTMILGGGMKPEKLTFSNKDMEFLAQLAWYRDKIMVGFGNTPASLGIIEDVNRANAEATLANWKQNTVKPDMDSIVNALNEFLVPEFGTNLILGYVNPVPEDRTDDIDESAKLYSGGIITRNEARELLNYESVQDGDSFHSPTPAFGQPSDGSATDEEVDNVQEDKAVRKIERKSNIVPSSLKHIDFKAVLRQRGSYLYQQHNKELKQVFKPLVEKIIKDHKANGTPITVEKALKLINKSDGGYEPPKHTKFSSEEIMDYYHKQMHSVDIIEDHFEKAVSKFLQYVHDKVADNLEREIDSKKSAKSQATALKKWQAKDVFSDNETSFQAQAQLDFTPLLQNLGVVAGQEAYKLVGVGDPYILSKPLKTLIANNVKKFTQSMLETDRDHIINLITNGIENGQSVLEIRNSLTEDLEYTKMQSTRITRTEILRTSSQSAVDAWEQSGVVEGKQWITAGATDECADYEGEIVTLHANVYEPENDFQDGDPPIHPNCRCALIPIVVDN